MIENITELITNPYLITIISAWLITYIMKTTINAYKTKKINLKAGVQNGGMPSSHAAVISTVLFTIYLTQGPTPLFFLSLAVTGVVLIDAITVRKEVGLMGEALNEILKKNNKKTLNVVKGHTPKQVIIGILIGLICSLLTITLF